MKLDDTFSFPIQFSQDQVVAFAEVSGDHNPIHLDATYAATTDFQRPIIHGMLAASALSRVIGMEYPGPGTIYMSQTLTFRRPMFVDTPYEIRLKVIDISAARHIAKLETVIVDVARGKPHLTGEAMIRNTDQIG